MTTNKKTLVIKTSLIPYGNWHIVNYKYLLDKSYIDLLDEDYTLHKQVIPYVLIRNNEGKFFTYNRFENEKRLDGFMSIGVGGHIKEGESVYECVVRELREEVGIIKSDNEPTAIGMVNSDIDSVSRVHIGIVFLYEFDNTTYTIIDNAPLHLLDKSAWKTPAEIKAIPNMESWSILSLQLIERIERS